MKGKAVEDLQRSAITAEEAEEAGIFDTDDASAEWSEFRKLPALIIPYPDPWTGEVLTFERDGAEYEFCRARYLEKPKPRNPFRADKTLRYAQPARSGVFPYLPTAPYLPFDWEEVAKDTEHSVIVTEGEKKALSAGIHLGAPAIGLGGAHNFMQKGELLPMLDRFDWRRRQVYIVFDSDAEHNPDIQAAEGRLATELAQKRGARVFLVRLPNAKGADKTGLDDLIAGDATDKLWSAIEAAPEMRKLDAAVVSLNQHVAWIEQEALVYNLHTKQFMRPSAFKEGSQYSALTVQVPSPKGKSNKTLSVPAQWLKHPLAQRYQEVLFRPEYDDRVVPAESSGQALNIWTGWQPAEPDPGPFLELNDYLFSELDEEIRDLPLKLMIYKAQNPGIKVPMALVLLGSQGSGKTLWADILAQAFEPYSVQIQSSALKADFNGWVENTLLCVINEARPDHVAQNATILRNLITETRQNLNEKFRAARQVNSYTQYILTANDRAVGSYSMDDRRMFVISCPPKREKEFYDRIVAWRDSGGPKQLLGWMLEHDLEGWKPPQSAPLTPEKWMAFMESLTPMQHLAEETHTADENVVVMWIEQALQWAQGAEISQNPNEAKAARETINALSQIQIRPFYTPEEMAQIFPLIAMQLHNTKQLKGTPAGEISRQLRDAGVTYLRNKDDPRGFRWKGSIRQFLVIANRDDWSSAITQKEFDRYMAEFPRYHQIAEKKNKKS